MHEKNLEMALYYDVYCEFLTEKQKNIVDMYYNEDYSLSEIAKLLSITRQGVLDVLKRGEKKMLDMDKKLNLVKR